METATELASWLDAELKEPGRSQSRLAARLGVQPSAVNRMTKGRRLIKAHELPIIQQYLAEDRTSAELAPTSTPGQRLRAARKEAGLAVSAVAAALAMSESGVRNQENGTNGIRPDTAAKYAELYGVAPQWILYGEGGGLDGVRQAPAPARAAAPLSMSADGKGNARLQIDVTVPMSTALQVLALLSEGEK